MTQDDRDHLTIGPRLWPYAENLNTERVHRMLGPCLEWAQVSPETIVVADSARAWIHRPSFPGAADPFATAMEGAGTVGTTRNLLEGCIAAAQTAVRIETPRPALTRARWIWRLAGYYHTTHATPHMMRIAATRFEAAGRTSLAAYAASKVADEAGHDTLALRDLAALGLDAEATVRALVPPTAAALVALFSALVDTADPVGCVGYAYALERLALAVPRDYLRQVEAVLPAGVNATRCLRVHSATGADRDHVEDALHLTAGLTAAERLRIARACHETTRIHAAAPAEGHVSESELARRISSLALVSR